MNRVQQIETRLADAFAPLALEVRDDSHLHAGHPGARSGKGHFHVHIVSAVFNEKTPVERHRLVYAALGDMMSTDIHALSLTAKSPDQR